jgi:VWFA-related protein
MPNNNTSINEGQRGRGLRVPQERLRLSAPLAALYALTLPYVGSSLADEQLGVDVSKPELQVPARPASALFEGVQGEQSTDITYDANTQAVTLRLQVQDPNGFFIPSIRPENFAVFENGQRQAHPTVEVERAPVTLAVLMEYGGRYLTLNELLGRDVALAANQIVGEIGRDDKITILGYGDRVQTIVDGVENRDMLPAKLSALGAPPASETNLYDAVISTLSRFNEISGRKALILISSGKDTFSQHTFQDALQAARAAKTPIYVINLAAILQSDMSVAHLSSAEAIAFDWKRSQSELGQIARSSGGRMYSPTSPYGLSSTFDDLMENLRVRYVITYRSSADPHATAPRHVRVELVDSRTGGPLSIADAAGRHVRARLSASGSYSPGASPMTP